MSDEDKVQTDTAALGLSKDDGSPVGYWDTPEGKAFKAGEKDRDEAAFAAAKKAHDAVTRVDVQAVSSDFTEKEVVDSDLTVTAKEAAKLDKAETK